MSYDVQITLFGKVSNPEAIWDLALAAASEGTIDWVKSFDSRRFVEMLEESAKADLPLILTRRDTSDLFESVVSACQEAGMAFVVKFGQTGGEGFSEGFCWRPGMRKVDEFLLDGENPVLRVEDVRRASAKGIDAVNALVERTEECFGIGKIQMDPGFMDEMEDYVGIRSCVI
jgi:hypothetical protein